MALKRIRKQIPYRGAAEHIDKNFQQLKGTHYRVGHLEDSYENLLSGAMSEGAQGALESGAGARFKRNISLGHTTGSYGDWQPVSTCAGYDIWKYAPGDYVHESGNVLFLDDQALVYRGLATSEQLTQFDKVYEEDGGVATDQTTEAASRYGTAFEALEATADYLYIGHSTTFGALAVYMQRFGIGLDLKLEYWNGSAWQQINGADITDGTVDFERDGRLSWTVPSDWATTTYQTFSKYWLRISTEQTPAQHPKFYAVVPAESVISLLFADQLSVSRGDYPWCSLGDDLYVSLRNQGNPDYEGISFIRSGSSTASLYSFFAVKHEFKASYQRASWTGGGVALAQRLTNLEASSVRSCYGKLFGDLGTVASGTIHICPLDVVKKITAEYIRFKIATNLGGAGEVGIYDKDGTRLAKATTATVAAVYSLAITATDLYPGRYYLAIAWPTSGTVTAVDAGTVIERGGTGPAGTSLPATITPSSITAANVPAMGVIGY